MADSAVGKHHGNPLTDDRLQLVEIEERLRLGIQATRMHIRALIARQRLQQVLADGAEEPVPYPDRSATGQAGSKSPSADTHS